VADPKDLGQGFILVVVLLYECICALLLLHSWHWGLLGISIILLCFNPWLHVTVCCRLQIPKLSLIMSVTSFISIR